MEFVLPDQGNSEADGSLLNLVLQAQMLGVILTFSYPPR